ncbi:uncharacterized protein LAESUDRAFT_816345 [Laetiporus sulphureus 93-53]|uniref:Ams2/SPT21 N-terminal domain-containing protein n=1 Tax=Laetiporus sulphureus 93-53 TaxID=1314785 RepID=A0A165BCJ5_9APHY|nr:uncharacterized protein LAESUDRAFT_816345 [Laetiporus sulphureus 93-53]KZT00742.1 hypothetical protein LAESUDRAFT_816345 [Laetiporus sulphureus 93-53]
MENRLLRVRALYTINGAPQYILALSHKPVSVSLIPSHLIPGATARSSPAFSSDAPIFGRAPLVPCLQAICHSSPELAPGSGRDYSVYALDPIESQARANGSGPIPVNVAIGLGLMSWSLQAANNDMTVIGTFISNGYREDSLEVIFSLREAAYMPLLPPPRRNPTADTNLRPLMTMKPLPIRRSRQSDVPSKRSRSKKPLAEPESSSFADSSTGSAFKEIGSMRGEDESSSLSGSCITFPADVFAPIPSSSSTSTTATDTQGILQTLLHALATSPSKNAQLLSALSTIDSQDASQQSNVALFEALQKLLSNVSTSTNTTVAPSDLTNSSSPYHASSITGLPQAPFSLPPTLPASPDLPTQTLPNLSSGGTFPRLVPTLTAPSSSKAHPQDDDDDIVILDKENVNPSAFRRRNTFSGKGKDRAMPAAVTATAAGPLNKSLTAPHRLISNSAHTDAGASSSRNEIPAQHCLEHTVHPPRVSTLDFRRGTHAFDTASEPARRPLRKRTLSEFMEERDREREARARRRRGLSTAGGNANTDVHAQSEPAVPVAVSVSSPAKGKAVDRGERLKRKRYIVPEWARTTTATQPRLAGRPAGRRDREESPSKRAKDTKTKQKTRKEFENAKAQERARGRERTRTVLSSSDALTSSASSIPACASSITSSTAGSAPASAVFRGEIKTLPRPIVADSSDVPVFSSPPATRPLATSSSAVPEPPSTPVRSRNRLAEPSSNNTDLFGSPLFTPRRAQSSPRTPRLPGIYAGRNLRFSPSRHSRESTRSVRSRRLRSLSPGIRHEELENVESPSSSLPVASSDVEDSGESEWYAGEQGWSRTLALSSPLPPSSPILSPEDDWVAEHEEIDADPEAPTDADADVLVNTVVGDMSEENKVDEEGSALPSTVPSVPQSPSTSVPQSFDSTPDPNQDAIPPDFALGVSNALFPTADNGDNGDFDFNAMFADMSGLDPAIAATSDFSVTSMPEFDFSTFTSSTDFDRLYMPDSDAFLDQSAPFVATTNADAMADEVDAVFGDLAAHDGLDFTQFWESMKPLVGESMGVAEAGEEEEKDATNAGDASAAAVTVDSAKLADSMQSLLSGCVM